MFDSLLDRYSSLTNREQWLLKAAGLIVPLMAMLFVGILVNRSFNSVESKIDQYEKVIDLINQVGPNLRTQQITSTKSAMAQKFATKAIKDNEIGMTSFVSTHAAAAGVQVDSYNENKQPKDTGNDSTSLTKVELDVQINEVELEKLMQLMERIETTGKPVFIERIRMTRRRRSKGKVRATIYVTTYKLKAES